MREAVHADGGLDRTWRTAILPLLEEHHYGENVDVVKRYGLDSIHGHVEASDAPKIDVTDVSTPADPS